MSTHSTYRAAYWSDGEASVRLTTDEQQHLSDDELMAAAQREAESIGLEMGEGRIVIGDWND